MDEQRHDMATHTRTGAVSTSDVRGSVKRRNNRKEENSRVL